MYLSAVPHQEHRPNPAQGRFSCPAPGWYMIVVVDEEGVPGRTCMSHL